jgi:hypothetical protein
MKIFSNGRGRALTVCSTVLLGLVWAGPAAARTASSLDIHLSPARAVPANSSPIADPQCALKALVTPDYRVAWPALVACFGQQAEVARAWLTQACVTPGLVPQGLRGAMCGAPRSRT